MNPRLVPFNVIRYGESDLPNPADQLGIGRRSKTVLCVIRGFGERKERRSHKCSTAEWAGIAALISACSFGQWENEYYGPGQGGKHWKLTLLNGNQIVKESIGYNGYPDCWNTFNALKQRCIRLVKREEIVEEKPSICPFCGSKNVKAFLFGFPVLGHDLSQYILGGCCVNENPPQWGCEDCEAKFFEGAPERADSLQNE